jgi:hypothetical protein
MKKTYNVYSKNALRILSASFFFTLFFLGMSSTVSAQFAPSAAAAGATADADFSITLKAQIGVSDELAIQILMEEFQDVREESREDLTPTQEAENSARWTFLENTLVMVDGKGMDLKGSLIIAHQEMARQVSNYQDHIRTIVDADGIVREYVERLK